MTTIDSIVRKSIVASLGAFLVISPAAGASEVAAVSTVVEEEASKSAQFRELLTSTYILESDKKLATKNFIKHLNKSDDIKISDIDLIVATLEQHPYWVEDDPELLFLRASAHEIVGELGAASAIYNQFLEVEAPHEIDEQIYNAALVGLLKLRFVNGEYAKGLKEFDRFSEYGGMEGRYYGTLILSAMYIQLGQYQAALGLAQRVYAEAYDEESERASAELLVNALRVTESDVGLETSGLNEAPLEPELIQTWLDTYVKEGRRDKKAQIGLWLAENNTGLSGKERLGLRLGAAEDLRELERLNEASGIAEMLLSCEDESNQQVVSNWLAVNSLFYAQYFQEQGRFDTSVALLEAVQGHEAAPESPERDMLFARGYDALDAPELAKDYYARVKESTPLDSDEYDQIVKSELNALIRTGDPALYLGNIEQFVLTEAAVPDGVSEYGLNLYSVWLKDTDKSKTRYKFAHELYMLNNSSSSELLEMLVYDEVKKENLAFARDLAFALRTMVSENTQDSTDYEKLYIDVASMDIKSNNFSPYLEYEYLYSVTSDPVFLSQKAELLVKNKHYRGLEQLFGEHKYVSILGLDNEVNKNQYLLSLYQKEGMDEQKDGKVRWLADNSSVDESKKYHLMILSGIEDKLSQEFYDESVVYINRFPPEDSVDASVMYFNFKYDALYDYKPNLLAKVERASLYDDRYQLVPDYYRNQQLVRNFEKQRVTELTDVKNILFEFKQSVASINKVRSRLNWDKEFYYLSGYQLLQIYFHTYNTLSDFALTQSVPVKEKLLPIADKFKENFWKERERMAGVKPRVLGVIEQVQFSVEQLNLEITGTSEQEPVQDEA